MHTYRISRKAFVSISALGGILASLCACDIRKSPGSKGSVKVSGSATSASSGPHGGVALETSWNGVDLSVEAGPAVQKNNYTVMRVSFLISHNAQVPADSASLSRVFSEGADPDTMLGLRMLDLERSLVYPQLNLSSGVGAQSLSKKKPVEIFPVFSSVGSDTQIVQLFLPSMGIVGVPVVKESDVQYSVDKILNDAKLPDREIAPLKLDSIIETGDGSSDTKQDEKSTTVTVAGDVTFATDSDQLSAQADSVLASVVEQVKKYPSGGDLTITGHTDDVADDAHNQDLSERRAKAVSERLKKLADLSAWKESVSGKGESSPRVPNDSDEHRQVNRRVEITLTPSKPAEASEPSSTGAAPSSAAMPKASGPVGKGPEGVDVKIDGKTVHVSMERAVRAGRFLMGTLMLDVDKEVSLPTAAFSMPGSVQDKYWPGFSLAVCSLTLLSQGRYYLEASYSNSAGDAAPLSNNFVYPLQPGAPTRLPAVWPDPGGDSIVLDVPPGENSVAPQRLSFRLTDIPVVDS